MTIELHQLTTPQYLILEQAARRGGAEVWGRQMAAVDNLAKLGLVTVAWWIEGRGAQSSRWYGRARATPEGKRLAKRPRPPIPLSVQVSAAARQLGYADAGGSPGMLGPLLGQFLGTIAANYECNIDDLRLDHEPALINRPYNHKIKNPAARYTPDANDPDAMGWRPQGRQFDASHDVKTNVRGDHGQLSDTALRVKRRKAEKKRSAPPRIRGGAKRPLRGANRWPPNGARKIQNKVRR